MNEANHEVKAIKEQIYAYLERHDAEDHAGEHCQKERLNLLAHLAHALGVRPEHFGLVQQLTARYDSACEHTHTQPPNHTPMGPGGLLGEGDECYSYPITAMAIGIAKPAGRPPAGICMQFILGARTTPSLILPFEYVPKLAEDLLELAKYAPAQG